MSNPPVLRLGGHGPVRVAPSLAAVAPDMGLLSQLVDMGFPIERAKKALIESSNKMGQALDWLERNADWEIPADVLNASLMAAQPGFSDISSPDEAFLLASVARESLGTRMDVDAPVTTKPSAPTAVQIATLGASEEPSAPMASRYESNSKDAYRERKRQKEIEEARIQKQKQVEEAARLKAAVVADRERRGGSAASHPATTTSSTTSLMDSATYSESNAAGSDINPSTTSSTTVSASDAADAHAAEIRAFEERRRLKEAEEEKKKKMQDAAERERIRREIETERAEKFGAEGSDKQSLTPAEQKAAYEAKQKEKAKEAWRLEQEANARRLAEIRQQLKEDRERKARQRESAKAAAAQSATSAPLEKPAAPAPTVRASVQPPQSSPSVSRTSSESEGPKRTVAEELAEARRARLGITTITGTQAHAEGSPYRPANRFGAPRADDDDDDRNMDIEAIKARNKSRQTSTPPAPSVPEPTPDAPESLADIHKRRFEEQRKKEKEEEERKARAERAQRMVANSASLAASATTSGTPKVPAPSSEVPSTRATSSMDVDVPLETSATDIPEEKVVISLRLPDGRIKRAGFKSRDAIAAVHKYAASWLPLDTIFALIVPVPRQEFTEDNMNNTTLAEAGLAPRGTLTVLTLQNRGQVRAAPPRPANLQRMMHMVNYEGSEMEAAEELANMSYEELLELQERIGFAPAGLTSREISSLPTSSFKPSEDGAFCVICQVDIEEGESIVTLPKCAHVFHRKCVQQWLKDHRTCPACRTRVYIGTTPANATDALNAMNEPEHDDVGSDASGSEHDEDDQ